MKFSSLFAVLLVGILFTSHSVKAEPKTDCGRFVQKTKALCNKQTIAPEPEVKAFCEETTKIADGMCKNGDVLEDCKDQAASGAASYMVACELFLATKAPQIGSDKIEQVCNKGREIFAINFFASHCEKIQNTIDI